MTALIILAAAAVLFLVFLVLQTIWQYSGRKPSPAAQLIPVDLAAFQNLIDPQEERFLRARLTASQFRTIQRARVSAAKLYVAALSENAAILAAAGQSARYHSDPEIAAVGLDVVHRAIKLKLWCILTLLRLNGALVFPTRLSPSGRLADQYMLVSSMAARLQSRAAA